MSVYTINGATYANAEQTAAVIHTTEAGDVLVGLVDTPDLWEEMLSTVTPNPYVPADWRPQAIADLNILRAKLIGILSNMQVDYFMAGNTVSADACRNAKDGLRVIETSPGVAAAYVNPQGTRAVFDLAVKQQWAALVAPAPSQVRSDFVKYGGNTT